VTCDSKMMSAWLCATIILENVEARSEDDRLYLPASSEFELTNEVKSVVTVLAKTHHYWLAHIAARSMA
jgi:sirohydrochlorin cobaltochelatase